MKYLVSLFGEEVTEINREPEEWESQYMTVFSSEIEAYKYAHSEQRKENLSQEASSQKIISQYRSLYFNCLWTYEPSKLRNMAPWHHNEIKEISGGTITL